MTRIPLVRRYVYLYSANHRIDRSSDVRSNEDEMPNTDHVTLRVLVTSIDGNLNHVFKRADDVGTVHKRAYDDIIKDKARTPFSATTIEFKNKPVADSVVLGTLAPGDKNHGNEIDLTLALTWESQGGRAVAKPHG
jgi:hypothetical protein